MSWSKKRFFLPIVNIADVVIQYNNSQSVIDQNGVISLTVNGTDTFFWYPSFEQFRVQSIQPVLRKSFNSYFWWGKPRNHFSIYYIFMWNIYYMFNGADSWFPIAGRTEILLNESPNNFKVDAIWSALSFLDAFQIVWSMISPVK